jgi:hypothetical protein
MEIKSSESALVYSRGGGCALIGAVLMAGLGVMILCFGLLVLYRSREPMFIGIAAAFFLMSALILSVAIPVLSTREGTTLDRVDGTATEWRAVFGRRKTLAVHNLAEFHSIEIQNRRNTNRSRTHVVQLAGAKNVMLCDLGLIEPAREAARDASRFLSLPVSEKTIAEDEAR